VSIKESIEYNLTVGAKVVTDQVGKLYTQNGLDHIKAHEQRRLNSYERAYKKYLEIFEEGKAIESKCSKDGLTLDQANKYKGVLEKWLIEKQKESTTAFKDYTRSENKKISAEGYTAEKGDSKRLNIAGGYYTEDGELWLYGKNLFDHIGYVAPVGSIKEVDMTCPKN